MHSDLIARYQLIPHPEGGHYRQVYASKQSVLSPVHNQPRTAVTHIYFLLQKGEISRFHKVHHDEIWHHYAGAPLDLYHFTGESLFTHTIGGEQGDYTATIPGGDYQAAESTGDYSLVGCTVAPGFDFVDFCFMDDPETQNKLTKVASQLARFI